jgi:hypothetical protein
MEALQVDLKQVFPINTNVFVNLNRKFKTPMFGRDMTLLEAIYAAYYNHPSSTYASEHPLEIPSGFAGRVEVLMFDMGTKKVRAHVAGII